MIVRDADHRHLAPFRVEKREAGGWIAITRLANCPDDDEMAPKFGQRRCHIAQRLKMNRPAAGQSVVDGWNVGMATEDEACIA